MKISDLRPDMRRVTLKGKIVEISEPRDVVTKYGESKVATAILSDDSGSTKLSLWNDTIDSVKVNDVVEIENGYVTVFRGEKQLNIGRFGKLHVISQ